MLGYTAAEMMNKLTPADISDPQEIVTRAKALSKELDTQITPGFDALVFKASRGIEDIYELTYIRKDGSRFPAIVSVTALRDALDEIIGYLLIGTDNSARQEADDKLWQASQYARSLLEASLDPLVTINADGKITDINEASIEATGLPREKLIGTDFSDYFTDPQEANKGYREAFLKGAVTDYPLTIRHRYGRLTDVLYNASVYRDDKGVILGVFAAARDITARKKAEEALVKAVDAKSIEVLDNALQEIERIRVIVKHMLVFVRGDSTHQPRCSLDDAVKRTAALLNGEFRKSALQLHIDLPSSLVQVKCSAGSLQQALVNLLLNGRDALIALKESVITISARQESGKIVLLVSDNGPGIDEQVCQKIFAPFFTTKPIGKGTGLGLAVSRQLLEEVGGSLDCASNLGPGACFRLIFELA